MNKRQSLISYVQLGKAATVRKMLEKGADPDEKDEKGRTSLHWAAQEAFLGIIRGLIRSGARINVSDDLGFTPLAIAAGTGHEAIVRELLNAGASPVIRNPADANRTVLHVACSWERAGVVKALVKWPGIEINARDNYGKTPLAYAIDAGNKELVTFLRRHGATT